MTADAAIGTIAFLLVSEFKRVRVSD